MPRTTQWWFGGLVTLCILFLPASGSGQSFSSGSTGADGAFSPTSNTTLTLPATGIFNFTTITIPAGVTVTFTKNAANTPVVLLATGNVTLAGTLDVSGSAATSYGRPGAGGPGGFDGGAGADGLTTGLGGIGLGPGGGAAANGPAAGAGGGGYGVAGASGVVCVGCVPVGTVGAGGPAYGNNILRPILGGSGGGGGGGTVNSTYGGGGGGGGGAIVIASSTSIGLTNPGQIVIRANGGNGSSGGNGCAGGGSGGAIRLIAPTISGTAQLVAQGGTGGSFAGNGGNGRIRLEASTLTYTGVATPFVTTGFPQQVFPPSGQPSLAFSSVGGVAVPASPNGSVLAAPDVVLPSGATSPVEVVLTAGNIPLGTAILVTAVPQVGAKSTATSGGLTGTLASSTATAPSLALILSQTSTLTATATFPLVASAGEGPLYADGEEVTHMKVAAVLGGGSTLIYITRSGREVVVQ